jgi:hypothetical protein
MLKTAGHLYEKTSVTAVGLLDLACVETDGLVQAWKKWKGWHALPPHSAWRDERFGKFNDFASIATVIDDGADYEFEYIGHAHVRAYGVNHQGKRLSELTELSPRFGRQLRASYDLARISGHPHAFQGTVGSENADTRFVGFETVYLPFGENGSVSHILNAAVYELRDDLAA